MFSNKNSGPILITVLAVLLLFVSYYYFVLPKKEEAKSLQGTVSSLQEEITNLQSQIVKKKGKKGQVPENLFAMQKKVPQDKDIVKLLLNVEEIEMLSMSKITGMQFNNYDALVSESELNDSNTPKANTEAADQTTTNETIANEIIEQAPTEELQTSSIAKTSLPPELQMVTFTLELEAMNETRMTIFVKELETLERIVRIDQIDLQVPGEADALEEGPKKTVSAKIQATTFYYEGE